MKNPIKNKTHTKTNRKKYMYVIQALAKGAGPISGGFELKHT